MSNAERYKHLEFSSKGTLRYNLQKLLAEVEKTGEYNLFLHKVYDFNEYGKNYNNAYSVRNNLKGIFNTGLSLKKYSSILQTTNYYGGGYYLIKLTI